MNFMRFKLFYFLISLLVLVPGIYSLIRFGLRLSVDFTGGSLLEFRISQSQKIENLQDIKKIIEEKGYFVSSIQLISENQFFLKTKPLTREDASIIKASLQNFFSSSIEELRFETIGPILGKELIKKTIVAIILASLAILFYIAWRFKNFMFGASAILAMFHDSLVMLGVFSLLGYFKGVEVDTLFVTAVLTVLSFSVHDTVVVYDKIREIQKGFPRAKFEQIVNKAVTETLPRSINNSMTIIFMLLALWLLGGETIKWFSFALLIGTISGTYSSTFTAAPLLVVFNHIKRRQFF